MQTAPPRQSSSWAKHDVYLSDTLYIVAIFMDLQQIPDSGGTGRKAR